MDEEDFLAQKLRTFIPEVFCQVGTPADVDFITQRIRQAVVYRGLKKITRQRLITTMETLSAFAAGCLSIEELKLLVKPQAQENVLPPDSPPVSTLRELKELAIHLSNLSRERAETLTTPVSPEPLVPECCSLSSEGKSPSQVLTPPSTPEPDKVENPISPNVEDAKTTNSAELEGSSQPSAPPTERKNSSRVMMVPQHRIGRLLGTGGSTINHIEATSGAQLTFCKLTNDLYLRGTKTQCQEASKMVMKIFEEPDCVEGTLYRLPFGFMRQRTILLEGRLEEISNKYSCKLRLLRGAYRNYTDFIFICGTLKSDVECCKKALFKWEEEFLKERNWSWRKDSPPPTPCSSPSPVNRIKYSREQLLSLNWSLNMVPCFPELALDLGIVRTSWKEKSPLPCVFPVSPIPTAGNVWDESPLAATPTEG